MATPHPTIELELIEAKGLLAADSNGLSDPFCSVVPLDSKHKEIRKEKVRTKICWKTLSPVWNEKFVLGDRAPPLPVTGWVHIKIKDKDLIGEEDLGEVLLPFDFL